MICDTSPLKLSQVTLLVRNKNILIKKKTMLIGSINTKLVESDTGGENIDFKSNDKLFNKYLTILFILYNI